ncbi:MAG: cyanophycinase [Saprospiraceae bacterium]|nr:cyanophycinase [Saprospiraceae bacterium]
MMSLLFALLVQSCLFFDPAYTSYILGDESDAKASPTGGVCLMGGAGEDDEAMRWFLRRAKGGDVLVLRASGADGYNKYMFETLGVEVNSVQSIVFHDKRASYDPYVQQQVANAEAIWLAGGNQWNYVRFWRNTPIDSIINANIKDKKIAIGGLSAGMAIMGSIYFSAELSSIQSPEALQDPLSDTLSIDNQSFLNIPFLQNVITDTHYAQRNRQGRHVAFLAKAYQKFGIPAKGIACDEGVAVCIDINGKAYVYGAYPEQDHSAYFIQTNCELPDASPEICTLKKPLHWSRNDSALKVYQIKAAPNGKHYFDLNDWKTGNGGDWKNWYVIKGEWKVNDSKSLHCKK